MEALPPLDQQTLQTAVHAALSDWTRLGQGDSDLAQQLLIVREMANNQEETATVFAARQATYKVLEQALSKLEEQDEIGAKVVRLRFYDGEITRQVAARLHASPDQVNRWQRAAIEGLTTILLTREMKLREDQTRSIMALLPPAPYSRLFGLRALQAEISEQLLRQGEPLVVALSGIGGIGKTSLADAVVRFVAPSLAFEQVIWVRANADFPAGERGVERSWAQVELALYQSLFTNGDVAESQEAIHRRLEEALNGRAVLVCIDNLEQEEQTVLFLERIRPLAGPSKFLLTTRARPTVSAPAYFRSLEELEFADAADLLRHHAHVTGIEAIAAAGDSDLRAVYDVAGGNPLALKLVAGLAAIMPLRDIISGLERSRPGPIEEMYKAVFWEAWQALSVDAQSLLQAMPLVGESGALPEQMMAISGLPEDKFWPVVHELFARSLLEVRGTVHERRYSIHQLTETFLQTEIVGWSQTSPRET